MTFSLKGPALATAIVAAISISTAAAQAPPAGPPPPTAPQAYVPFTVSEADYMALRQYLEQQPHMFSRKVIDWLDGAEGRAIAAAAAAAKAKTDADEAAKPAESVPLPAPKPKE
jgi:hypothetical protein